MQPLELRSKKDVSKFLSQTPKKDFESPAAGYYNRALRTYVFFSDNLPLKEFSAIKLTSTGSHVADYDRYDSCETYFTRYLIRGTHISLQFVPSSSEYDHVYCKRRKFPAQKESRSCKKNLAFIQEVVNSTTENIRKLQHALSKDSIRYVTRNTHRIKRANALISAILFGTVAGITSSVVNNLLPSSLLASEAERTDELLDSLGERAN